MLTELQNKELKTNLITLKLNGSGVGGGTEFLGGNSMDQRRKKKRALHKVLVCSLINGIYLEYNKLFEECGIEFKTNVLATFLQTLIVRVKMSKLQFKKASCILIKLLNSCLKHKINYLKYYHNDFKKVLIGVCILSFSSSSKKNVQDRNHKKSSGSSISSRDDILQRLAFRERDCEIFALTTGLSVEEISNISSVARTIVERQSRLQNKTMQRQRYIRRHTTNLNTSSYPYIPAAEEDEAESEDGFPTITDTNDYSRDTNGDGGRINMQDFTDTSNLTDGNPYNQRMNHYINDFNVSNLYNMTHLAENDHRSNMNVTSSSHGIHKVIENIISTFGEESINQYGLLDDENSFNDVVEENNESEYVLQNELERYNKLGKKMVNSYFNFI